MTDQAHRPEPPDTRTVDEYIADGLRDPKLWTLAFIVLFGLLFVLAVLFVSGTPPPGPV